MEDEVDIAKELRRMVDQIEGSPSLAETNTGNVVARARRLRMRRRAVLSTCAVALIGVAAAVGLTLRGAAPGHQAGTNLKAVPVLDVASSINMDIITAQSQVSVNLASGNVEQSTLAATKAASGSSIAMGIQRQGYLVGVIPYTGKYVSVSNDLQTVLHAWTGKYGIYGAPASNPSDLWISNPGGTRGQATEVNGYEVAVGPSVGIPSDSIVAAQEGSDLVLATNGTGHQSLELWNPTTQQVVADYGAYDQVASSATQFAWTAGNTLHIVGDNANATGQTIVGPVGDWATEIVFSPDGSKAAVDWRPEPGSANASSISQAASNSIVMIVDTSSGTQSTVPGSSGVTGPIAWMPDGTRVFYGQVVSNGQSTTIATFALGSSSSQQLTIPGIALTDYTPSTSGLIIWSK